MNKAGQFVLPVAVVLAVIGAAVTAGKLLSRVDSMVDSMTRIEVRVDRIEAKGSEQFQILKDLLAQHDRRLAILESRK
jgi:hypothetical protein